MGIKVMLALSRNYYYVVPSQNHGKTDAKMSNNYEFLNTFLYAIFKR